jgi:hypothetical protein
MKIHARNKRYKELHQLLSLACEGKLISTGWNTLGEPYEQKVNLEIYHIIYFMAIGEIVIYSNKEIEHQYSIDPKDLSMEILPKILKVLG